MGMWFDTWTNLVLAVHFVFSGHKPVTTDRFEVHQACAFEVIPWCWKSNPAGLEIELGAVCWLKKKAVFRPPFLARLYKLRKRWSPKAASVFWELAVAYYISGPCNVEMVQLLAQHSATDKEAVAREH